MKQGNIEGNYLPNKKEQTCNEIYQQKKKL